MTPRTKKVLFVLPFAALGGALVALNAGLGDAPHEPLPPLPERHAEDEAPAIAAAAAAIDPMLPAWHPARTWSGRYTLDVDARLERSASLGGDGAVGVRAALEVARAPDGGWITGRLTSIEVRGDAPLRAHFTPPPGSDPAFALRVDEAGAVLEDRYAMAMPVGLRNVVATLVEGLVPADGGDATTATRTWRRGGDDDPGGSPYGQGRSELVRDALGLVSAAYSYTLDADVTLDPSAPMWQRAVTTMRLVRDDGPRVAAAPATPIDPAGLVTERQRDAQRPRPIVPTRGRTVDQIVAQSDAAHSERDQTRAGELAAELVATIEQRPQALADAIARLGDPALAGHRLRAITTALVDARSPEARATVAALVGDATVPYLARHSLVTALTFVKELSPEVLAATIVVLDDRDDVTRVAAAHALAAQGKLQESRDPALAASLRAELIARATPSLTGPGDADRDLWLSALGNLGGADLWPLVGPHVTSRDTRERLHAIEALRFVPLPAARLALAKAMRLDPEHANRRRAVEMALYHPQAAMQDSVVRALAEDPDPSVRLGAAHVLAVWGVTSPALDDVVARAAEAERHPEVKRALHELRPVSLDSDRGEP